MFHGRTGKSSCCRAGFVWERSSFLADSLQLIRSWSAVLVEKAAAPGNPSGCLFFKKNKKKSKWLSVHILLETDCMHQCGDWRRLWTPRKKICGRLALLLKEVKAHAQKDWEVFFLGKRDWGGREVEIVHCSRHKNRATHYLTKYAYDEVSSVVCIR